MNIKGTGSINELVNYNNTRLNKDNITDGSFEKKLESILEKKDDKELKKVCKDFEGVLLQMMYKEMRATVHKSGLIEEDYGKKVYEEMLDEKLVESAVNSGGIGLGDALYKLLKPKT
ncbi:rod-binding protein [Pseudobacteroides cellulosolvens]|uniref:Flagellar protein FlgJ n=1 Tax=Pseudobacteroides cellulosolvens ATCC 35603 = DSM 2933 TaxID=398512 RepID=A0A0L6JNE8_9FIRM|nr:rod-binding protein [Pseudobacteroides cellulosolvens]KNY27328.1 Flagellar protein FlgJ [Pseudobacteroides cellulosolvens ATCC 35603 = DSM 2933]